MWCKRLCTVATPDCFINNFVLKTLAKKEIANDRELLLAKNVETRCIPKLVFTRKSSCVNARGIPPASTRYAGLVGGGYPRYPPRPGRGYPCWGYPPPGPGWWGLPLLGVPPISWMGYPPPSAGWGTPPPPRTISWTGYPPPPKPGVNWHTKPSDAGGKYFGKK